jgi:hypothetical protein
MCERYAAFIERERQREAVDPGAGKRSVDPAPGEP